MDLAVIGLGQMGLGMAGRLQSAGLSPRCFDISGERRGLAARSAIAVASSLADAAASASVVILSLPDADAVAAAVDETRSAVTGGCVWADASTISVASARAMAGRVAASGGVYLDAPVSGGPAGAAAGTLTMMVGGPVDALDRVRPVLAHLASQIVHAGPPGAGQAAKLANNILLATHMIAAAEAIRIARSAGVSPEVLLDVVNAASGRSAATEVNLPRWVLTGRFDSGFTASLMRKDVGLALEMAQDAGGASPVLERAAAIWLGDSLAGVAGGEDFNRVLAWAMAEDDD